MTDLISQPTGLPTRKLTAAIVGGTAVGIVQWFVTKNWPEYTGLLQIPGVSDLTSLAGAFLFGYIVKDRATYVIVEQGSDL